jgi:hypothetical protein
MSQAISQDLTTIAIYQILTIHMFQDPIFMITQAFILLDMILTIHIIDTAELQLTIPIIQHIADTMIVIIHLTDILIMFIQDHTITITCTIEALITADPTIEALMTTIM